MCFLERGLEDGKQPQYSEQHLTILCYFSIFWGFFCLHYFYFASKPKWCILYSSQFYQQLINVHVFTLVWVVCHLNYRLQRTLCKLLSFIRHFQALAKKKKEMTPCGAKWVICDGNWWVHPARVAGRRGQSEFSATHLLGSPLPYPDQTQQLENQVLWLILTFSTDYRGALV